MEPWECPRCHVIHAPWVPKCKCKPVEPKEQPIQRLYPYDAGYQRTIELIRKEFERGSVSGAKWRGVRPKMRGEE